MKQALLIIGFITSLSLSQSATFKEGVALYENRGENAQGMIAQPGPINSAIDKFKEAQGNVETELNAGIYLLRCYYYKGKFVVESKTDKKSVFNEGKALAEALVDKYPESVAVRYWYLANLGSWSEVYGILTAAKEGVADLMRLHSEKIIELDPGYWDGGGYFMLGAVHFKSPYIPFLLSWPSNDEAVEYLTLAYETGSPTPSQIVYLARALHKDGQKDQAIKLLDKLISTPLSDDELVEDYEQQDLARELLSDWD